MSKFVIGDVLQLQQQSELEDIVSFFSNQIDTQNLGERVETPQRRATPREQFEHPVGNGNEIPTFVVERERIDYRGCDIVHVDSYRPIGRDDSCGVGFEPIVDLGFDICESFR
jgi:hypothetical protein